MMAGTGASGPFGAVARNRVEQLLASSRRVGLEVVAAVLAEAWSRRDGAQPRVVHASMAPSDHLQRPMNLIMPLHRPNLISRGLVTQALVKATDEVISGLNNIGTVHFARFDIVAGNLCMFSIYDGDLSGYVRDFVVTIGNAFDQMFQHVKDPPAIPVRHNVEEFVAWVRARDAFQLPEQPTGLITRDLVSLERDTVLALHRHPNVQLGVYRGYPGASAAQIRQSLSVGW
jgi:hypothetical protein